MNILTTIIIPLIGGLAFFLYGMNVMSSGLERMAGGKLERMLKKMTSSPFKSLLLGAGITIAIQSSSAMTVMLVGLVNSGIMAIGQTVGVIMGSNIGTTLTAWLLSTVGIETDNVWLSLLKPENFSLIFAFVGSVLIMMSKKQKKKDIGTILLGFAVLMFGMKLMSGAMKPLTEAEGFKSVLTAFDNPILAVIIGAVFTGIIQSSAASVGILQGFALSGSITYGMAIPIIMGQNIGTCATALISSIGVNRNAKKVAVIHISFNLIGTVVFLALFYGLDAVFNFAIKDATIDPMGVSIVHSIFNVATTILLFPFSKLLVKIANVCLPDKSGEETDGEIIFDQRLLATPSIAISECNDYTYKMAEFAKETLIDSFDILNDYTEKKAELILKKEDRLDKYEDRLGTTLVHLSSNHLSDDDSRRVSKMLHVIGDFERLGDHAVNILKVAEELSEKKLSFSEKATEQISVLRRAIEEILDTTINAYIEDNVALAKKVEPLEEVVDDLVSDIKNGHIERLQAGDCTMEMGFILSDLLNNYERISDHCSNIAVSVIEINHDTYDTHKYLNDVKQGSKEFNAVYEEYKKKYSL